MRLIVVGAGITGAACAYAASGRGAEVILVDAGLPGQATAAGAGIICPWTSKADDPAWYAFACAAARQYPDLVAGLAEDGESVGSYRQVGALIVTRDGEEAARAGERMRARRAGAPEIGAVEVVTEADARAMFPPLRPDSAALFVGGAARVDGRQLAGALVSAARSRGAVIRPGRAVLAWRAGRVTGVEIDGELTGADAVVAATGAWTTSFVAPAGAAVTVEPQRGQIVHISLGTADTSRWPVVLPAASGHYLLAFDDSRVVAGATRETGSGFDVRVTPGGLHEVLAQALAVAPGLASGTHLETRVGLRPAAARPLLGPVPGLAGLVVATGLGASGLTMGPLAGAVAAEVALGIEPDMDLAPFRPTRS